MNKNATVLQIGIEIPHSVYAEIEEKCTADGISISEYFLKLHLDDKEAEKEALKMIKAKEKVKSDDFDKTNIKRKS